MFNNQKKDMQAIQIFEYEGTQIEFDLGRKNIMVNATEMAKAFGKRVSDFLRLDSTKAFIEVLKLPLKSGNLKPMKDDEIMQTKGRSGTWMCRILALKFAAWLDATFEVWVYFTIDKIMFGAIREEKEKKDEKEVRRQELLAELLKMPEYQEFVEVDASIRDSDKKIKRQLNNQLNLF